MLCLVSCITVFVFGASCPVVCGAEANKVRNTIDILLKKNEFEAASTYILQEMPDSNDKSFLAFKLSQIEVRRGDLPDAIEYFSKALHTLPDNVVVEQLDNEIERTLDVASLLRLRRVLPVVSSMLNALHDKRPNYSSIQYELSNFFLVQNKYHQFFEHFYKAYRINPANPRALPGKAVIRSVIDGKAPLSAIDFPWLAAAIEHYDNPMIWLYVMQALRQHGFFDETEKVALFAEATPPKIRNIFYYYYYSLRNQQEDALKSISLLKPFTSDDFRLDICRRNLLLTMGQVSVAMDGLELKTRDPYRQALFYDLWLAYWDRMQWNNKTVSFYEAFLDALSQLSNDILTDAQITFNENYLLAGWAHNLAQKQRTEHAVMLLEACLGRLDAPNLSLLASLHLSSDQYSEALSAMKKQLAKSEGHERREVMSRILDYSALVDDWDTVQQYLNEPKHKSIDSFYEQYRVALEFSRQNSNIDHRILNVPAHFLLDKTDWRQWEGFGPCATGSAFSVTQFWKRTVQYAGILADFSKSRGGGKTPLTTLEEYLGSHNLALVYVAPTRTAIVDFLSKGVPLILLNTTLVNGLTFRHASVVYAFDDRLRKVFCRNSSDSGESRLLYTELPEVKILAAVVPRSQMQDVISGKLKNLVIPSRWEVLTPDSISKLSSIDPMLKYWSYRHNGDAQLKREDATSCINWYEKCIGIKEPSSVAFYEDLSLACLYNKQEEKGIKYLGIGLKKEPRSLLLLRYKIQVQIDIASKTGKFDSALGRKLLALTDEMEVINPDYPFTYFLRGDLYVGAMKDHESAITAFQLYLEKYNAMNRAWKIKYIKHRDHAQRAIGICRNSLFSEKQ